MSRKEYQNKGNKANEIIVIEVVGNIQKLYIGEEKEKGNAKKTIKPT